MLSKAEIKRLRALARRKGREQTGLFLAEGVRLAEDLLAAGTVLRTALVAPSLQDTARGSALLERLRAVTAIHEVTEQQLREVADTESPQGVVIAAAIPHYHLSELVLSPRACIVVVDAVQDPGNFGTIVRSADAFGAAAVVALPGTVDPWNPKAVRSAMGSSLRVPIVEAGLIELVAFLRGAGCTIFGADAGGADAACITVRTRVALVLGNEGAGLGEEIRSVCDRLISIPMSGNAESLNVAVAAGIMLYLLTRTP